MNSKFAIKGAIVHSFGFDELEIIENGGIGVDENGIILFVSKDNEQFEKDLSTHQIDVNNVTTLNENEFLMPGFIDTHCHAPQYVFTGNLTFKI